MKGDWIKIHRKMLESTVMSNDWICRLWINLLVDANWKSGWFQTVEIPRGSFAFAYRNYAGYLGVSVNRLRRGLKTLEKHGSIAIKTERGMNTRFTVVTIVNWETYQSADQESGTRTDTRTDTRANTRANTDRRREEGKKGRRNSSCPRSPSDPRRGADFTPEDVQLAEWMFGLVLDVYAKARPPNIPKWSDTIRLMRTADGRSHDEIRELFAWANADSFWAMNIRAPGKLREKWEDLDARRSVNSKPPKSKIPTREEMLNWTP